MSLTARHHVPASGRRLAAERSVKAHTLGRMVLDVSSRHSGTALRVPRQGDSVEWSYARLGADARDLARGLMALGITPGDRVSILAGTRPEWTVADCAALCAGATVVPIYQTNSPEECAYVLSHSGARVVICENADQVAKVRAVEDRCPDLEHVVSMEPVPGERSFDDLRSLGADVADGRIEEVLSEIGPNDLATIVYTSGTTGPPKGCMLSHATWLATMDMYEHQISLGSGLVIFLFLPLAHSLARITQLLTLDVGGTLAFWSGDPARLLEDVAEAQPTHLPSVPRVFEKIHTKATAAVQDAGGPKERIFRWALAVGRRAREADRAGGMSPPLRAAHAVADRLVLAKVRDLFGGRLDLALTGAAPIGRQVLEFFDACGVLVLEGYGMTETCAAATLNTPKDFRFGTVGKPLPGTEVAIAEDGEVLMRGPHVFKGYYRDEDATRETFDADGWLKSGDLGMIDADGFLHITGRKKDLIITSSGKNITPSNLESELRESRWVSQAVVYGDNRSYLVALLTLDPEEALVLASELGTAPDIAAMARDDRVHAVLARHVESVNARFARIEQIKRFAILDHDLTQAAGELTPTLKVKRATVYDRYGDDFRALYA
jgi:long-chain acyl-CoA synthetase